MTYSGEFIDPETGFRTPNISNAVTPERKLSFLKAFKESNLRVHKACQMCGWDYKSLNYAMKCDPAFKKAIDMVRMENVDEMEGVLTDRAKEGKHPAYLIFWLKNNYKEKYGDQMNSLATYDKNNLLEKLGSKVEIIEAEVVGESANKSSEMRDVTDVGQNV